MAEFSDTSKWSTYAQYRRLLEAAGEVLGRTGGLSMVGKHVSDSVQSPDLSESLAALRPRPRPTPPCRR